MMEQTKNRHNFVFEFQKGERLEVGLTVKNPNKCVAELNTLFSAVSFWMEEEI